jgi:hypothetical protein
MDRRITRGIVITGQKDGPSEAGGRVLPSSGRAAQGLVEPVVGLKVRLWVGGSAVRNGFP